MRLADWLAERRMSAAEFAAKLDVHRSTVCRWIETPQPGEPVYRPSWEQLAKIREATDGEVTANDFVDAARTDSPAPSQVASQ